MKPKSKRFDQLVALMAKLRAPNGCPWDRQQTHRSLRPYLLEEAHEVLEAIDKKDPDQVKDELGDLLFQIIFHARIAEEAGQFDIYDVIEGSVAKMTRRHPHIFGQTRLHSSAQVLENWEEIKKRERKGSGKLLLDGVPRSLPALLRAHRVQSKAARVGFHWVHVNQAMAKVAEEIEELEEAIVKQRSRAIMEELGDALFALVNLARYADKNPEDALHQAVTKFIKRFSKVEQLTKKSGQALTDLNQDQLLELWQQAKRSQSKRKTKAAPPRRGKSPRLQKKPV